MNKVNAVSVELERKTRKPDGAGGFTEEWAAVGGSPFSARIVRTPRRNRESLEAAPAGDVNVIPVVLVFDRGVDVRVNDRCMVSGTAYKVEGVRSYFRSIQADVRAVL